MEQIAFPRYEQYKPSGFDWLGDVPLHWNIVKNKTIFLEKKDAGEENLPMLSVSLNTGVSKEEQSEEENARARIRTENKKIYKKVRSGDIVFNMMRAWQGAIGVVSTDGMVSPAYIVATPKTDISGKFIDYLYRTNIYVQQMNRFSKGITDFRKRLYWDEFKQLHTLMPPIEEQRRIVEFLNQKTTEIDEATTKKQRLIELLKEQKAILINQAVTKGLNPDVPMRNSGVEWIGDIPEHWTIRKLKYFTNVQSGVTLGKLYNEINLPFFPYLRVANVQAGHFDLSEIAELRLPKKVAEHYFVRKGDILITEGGDIDKLGRGTVWEGEIENCLHQNHIFAVRVTINSISEYFISLVLGADYGRRYFTNTANKTTNLASTNKTKLGNFPVALPPDYEQKMILDFSQEIDAQYNRMLNSTLAEINALLEYKQTIVSEAVTGKIKL